MNIIGATITSLEQIDGDNNQFLSFQLEDGRTIEIVRSGEGPYFIRKLPLLPQYYKFYRKASTIGTIMAEVPALTAAGAAQQYIRDLPDSEFEAHKERDDLLRFNMIDPEDQKVYKVLVELDLDDHRAIHIIDFTEKEHVSANIQQIQTKE